MSDCVYPCPCGYFQDSVKECTCSNQVITRYQKRISGPMLDRIDIHIEVPRVDYEKLSDDRLGEPSAKVQVRVEAAREQQRERFSSGQMGKTTNDKSANSIACNADMRPAQIRQYCQLDETSNSLMRTAMHQMQLSARAYHRVLKLARTIADLAGEEQIAPTHLAEALQYRPKLGMM
jgi:magnesium chelatase family protein